MSKLVCDATLVTDSAGRIGRIDIIVSGESGIESVSVPVSSCSEDRVEVWHGMDTPAISCGKHAAGHPMCIEVFRGHRNRVAINDTLAASADAIARTERLAGLS